MSKAVFLDRDGVLNVDFGYPHKVEQLEIIPGVYEGLAKLQSAGYLLFIVSNQSGIGRGYFDRSAVEVFNQNLINKLAQNGINITDVSICPHTNKEGCDCRKPKPKMILELAERYGIDLRKSALIGDKGSDIEAGNNAGLKICIKVPANEGQTLISAASRICEMK